MIELVLIFIVAPASAVALIYGLRWAAKRFRFGGSNLAAAMTAFEGLGAFEPAETLCYFDSAIAFDPKKRRVAVWEKKTGARLVEPREVGAWHSGVLTTLVLGRGTTTPMVQLFAKGSSRPFFKVGVVDPEDCKDWTKHLSAAFGADKGRSGDARVLGEG